MSTTPPIRIEGYDSVKKMLAELDPALKRANERAQNKMAYNVMMAEREQARGDLDSPRPSTVNTIVYKKYGVDKVEFGSPKMTVYVSDIKGAAVVVGNMFGYSSLATIDSVLGVQIEGGLPAGPKRSERALMDRGFMRPDQMWVPAELTTLDQYGNIPGSQWSKALTDLGFNLDYAKPVQKQQFAVIGGPGNYMGIWRKYDVNSTLWFPWVYFVDRPMYSERYAWDSTADLEINLTFGSIWGWYLDDELNNKLKNA